MTKQARPTGKRARRDQRNQYAQHAQDAQYGQRIMLPGDSLQVPAPRAAKPKPWVYLNDAQHALGNAITVYPITFAVGEFGTGKTFVPAAMAADAFLAGLIEKIIITRPAVGCDEEHGFLPGDLNEKVAPWAQPVIDVLNERMGAGFVDYLIKAGKIEIAPLGMLRGRTFSNAFVMLDEAQNTTPKQMKLFLSRIGEGTKMVVDGDLEQKDITGPSGLADAIARFRDHSQFGYVEFGVEDIVRSGIAKEICYGYSVRYQRQREQMIAAQSAPAFLAASIPA